MLTETVDIGAETPMSTPRRPERLRFFDCSAIQSRSPEM